MNQDNDQDKVEIDAQVSGQYKSLASEEAPPHLDQSVLREAKRALRADNRKGFFGAWFRPLAFVTTVGLSLAIILELVETGIFSPVTDLPVESAPGVPASAVPPDDRADRAPSQPALNEIKRQEKLAPAQSRASGLADGGADDAATPEAASELMPTDQGQLRKMRRETSSAEPPPVPPLEDQLPDNEPDVSDAFAAGAENTSQRMQKIEGNVAFQVQRQPATDNRVAAPQASFAVAPMTLESPSECSDEQKTDAGEWWQCITALRNAELAELADQEYENLRESFPDFEAPE